MEGTQGTKRTERSVILCGDVSRPVFLCEACYEKLSNSEKSLYQLRTLPPVLLNNWRAGG